MLFETALYISLLFLTGRTTSASSTTPSQAASSARQITGTKPSAFLPPSQGTKPQTLFDDFCYADYKQLNKNGWIIRTAPGWPGVPGATWGTKGVALLPDPDRIGRKITSLIPPAAAGQGGIRWLRKSQRER